MFWSMPGTGHCARFTACSEILAHPNSSQAPHWAQWLVPGKFHYYMNVFLIIQTEYCTKQQGHKKKKVHTLSLSLSLSLTFSWRPARSPDKTAPCKSQPHHHKSMFLEENCFVLTCASVHVSCENLFIPVLDRYRHLDIPVWSWYWVSF